MALNKTLRGITIEIEGKTDKLAKDLKDVEKQCKSWSDELKAIDKLLKFDPGNVEALTQKKKALSEAIESCSERMKVLEGWVDKTSAAYGENSDQLNAVKREIEYTNKTISDYEKQLRGTISALGNQKNATEDAKEALQRMKEEAEAAKTPLQRLSESMTDLNKDSSNLSTELKEIEQALKKSPDDIQLLSQKYKVLSEALENSRDRLDTLLKVQKEATESGNASEAQLRDLQRQIINTRSDVTRYKETLEDFKTATLNLISGVKSEEQAFKELQDSIKETDTKSKSLSTELREIDNVLKSSPGNVTLLSQRYDVLKESVDNCAEKLELVEQAEQDVQRRFEQGEASASQVRKLQREIEELTDDMRRYQSEMADADAKLNDFGNEAKQAANKLDDLGDKAKQADNKMSGLKSAADHAGDGFTTFKGVISNLISEGLEVLIEKTIEVGQYIGNLGMDFGQSMSKVEALLNLPAQEAGAAMEKLTQLAMDLGAKTKFSANESAEAMTYLAQAGWKTEDIMANLAGVMDLAAVDGIDLASAAEIVATSMNALKDGAGNASNVADVLAVAASESATNVEEMGYAFKYAAPLSGSLGYSIKDLGVAIGLMADNNIRGEQAGTSLRRMLVRMSDPTDECAAAMKKYGISLYDSEGNALPLIDVIGKLRDTFSGLSDEQQAQLGTTLAGQTGLSGLLSIVNASDDSFAKMTKAIAESDGAANRMAITLQDNLAGDVEKLGGAFDTLGLSIMQKFDDPLRQATQAITQFLDGEMTMKELLAQLTDVVAQMGQKFQEYLPTLSQIGQDLLVYLINGITVGIPALVTKAGDLILQFCTGIANNMPSIINTASKLITDFIQAIINSVPKILEGATRIVSSLAQGIQGNAASFVSKALDLLDGFADKLTSALPKLIESGMQFILNMVKGLTQALPEFISRAPEIISKFANLINDNFPTILKKGVEIIWELIKGIVQAIPTLVANIPKIITAIVDVWEAFNWLSLGKKAIDLLGKGIKGMVGFVKNCGTSIKDGIVNVIKNLPDTLKNLAQSAANGLGNALRAGVSNIKTAAKTIFNAIKNTLADLPSKALEIGKNLVKGLWNGISDMAGWVIGKIQGFGESVLGGLKDFFGIKSPSREFAKIGRYLDEGLAKGLLDYADDPIKAAQDMATGVLDGAAMDGLALERSLQNRTIQHAMSVTTAADSSMLSKLDKILTAIERGQILTLDGKALVGGTVNAYDTALGQRRMLAARGAV